MLRFLKSCLMSDNYYDRSSRWRFDSDGNFLYSKRRNIDSNIERDGYWYTNLNEWEIHSQIHLKEESDREFELMWSELEKDIEEIKKK